jgi:DNA (cytosine-5)-methyltransferase 1
LDLGFDRAGFRHSGSYDIIPICGETISHNRPSWTVKAGEIAGDVRSIDWSQYEGEIQLMHGGPPCQPFSIAGQQQGLNDERNMWGPYTEAINKVKPAIFVAENVMGLLDSKFSSFIEQYILRPLKDYRIKTFTINAAGFGVPQSRQRVIFVGFRSKAMYDRYRPPENTHTWNHLVSGPNRNIESNVRELALFPQDKQKTMGVRQTLGLSDIGYDALAPTLRSGFTGKRNTTSIVNSTAAAKLWAELQIWPNGVGANREAAHKFPAENGHFRLSVQDCGIIQGFPESWVFQGPVYKILGQIGNSVAPPVAYRIAESIRRIL